MMFSFVVLGVISLLIVFSIAQEKITVLSNRVEDGLVSATLAGATVDLTRYATDGKIVNIEEEGLKTSYKNFKDSLKTNLNLDNNFKVKKDSIIKSKINIDKFTVYSKVDGKIYVNTIYDNSISRQEVNSDLKTPNGKVVDDTTVYSKISFTINILGKDYKVPKDTSVKVTDK